MRMFSVLILSMLLSPLGFARDIFGENPGLTPYQILEKAYNQSHDMQAADLVSWKNKKILASGMFYESSTRENAYSSYGIAIIDINLIKEIPATPAVPAVPPSGPLFPGKPAIPEKPAYSIKMGRMSHLIIPYDKLLSSENVSIKDAFNLKYPELRDQYTDYCKEVPANVLLNSYRELKGKTFTVFNEVVSLEPYCGYPIDNKYYGQTAKTEFRMNNDGYIILKNYYKFWFGSGVSYGYMWQP